MKTKLLSEFAAGLITLFVASTPAHAFFHSNKISECNDEGIHSALTELANKHHLGGLVRGVPSEGDGHFISNGFKQIRQEEYDNENKRRECNAVVTYSFSPNDGMTFDVGWGYREKSAKFNIKYAIEGTSDGDIAVLQGMWFHNSNTKVCCR